MHSCGRYRLLITPVLLVALALAAPAVAEAQPQLPNASVDGLFLPLGGGGSVEVRNFHPGSFQGGAADAAGVIRSRRVALDMTRLDGLALRFLDPSGDSPRQDQPPLLLNFFDDAAIEIVVDTIEPAVLQNGYVVSGSVPGEIGNVVLVVHFDDDDVVTAVSGSASAAEGAFRISTVGEGVYAIEELDTTVPWSDGVLPDEPEPVDPPLPPSADAGGVSFSLADRATSTASSEASEIDVLVLYTAAAATQVGGDASMRAEVEKLFSETNRAFSSSGVAASIRGWAREVSYVESEDLGTDLSRLRNTRDGYLDDIHSTRSELGADLVHLLVAFTPEKSDDGSYTCGLAYTSRRREYGFAVTLRYAGCNYTFTHELGHNLGLHHDRYQQYTYESDRSPAHVPYAYGYSNASTFSPVGGGQCWSTVMAYYKHCYDVPGGRGFYRQLLSFSNPHNRHPSTGEPMGVLGEKETRDVDGPADAARALERTAARVAGYYDRRPAPGVIGVDLAVRPGSVTTTPTVVDVDERLRVEASITNLGSRRVGSSTASFWSKYDDPDAEWVRHGSTRLGGLSAGASRTIRWRGTGGSEPGTEYWAVCIYANNDVDDDNDCQLARETVVIRDPDVIDGVDLVTESEGNLAVGAQDEIGFVINDVTGEEFQIQPHWFLLSYEPVDVDVWGAINQWHCFEEERRDCWNANGTENTDADWDWRTRAWGFGTGGLFINLLGIEAYSWSEDDKWQFTFGEATSYDEDPDTEIIWRFAVLRELDDENEDGSASGGVGGVGGLAPVVGSPSPGVPLEIPAAMQDAIRRSRAPR